MAQSFSFGLPTTTTSSIGTTRNTTNTTNTIQNNMCSTVLHKGLASYNKRDPQLWFTQLDSLFAVSKITEDFDKYNYLVSCLDAVTATKVRDFLIIRSATKPNQTSNEYEELKKLLLLKAEKAELQKNKNRLDNAKLGQRKPSEFLEYLIKLGPEMKKFLTTEMFVKKMPQNIQQYLNNWKSDPLELVARVADTLIECTADSKTP